MDLTVFIPTMVGQWGCRSMCTGQPTAFCLLSLPTHWRVRCCSSSWQYCSTGGCRRGGAGIVSGQNIAKPKRRGREDTPPRRFTVVMMRYAFSTRSE